jgi:chromosome segregation ATPase
MSRSSSRSSSRLSSVLQHNEDDFVLRTPTPSSYDEEGERALAEENAAAAQQEAAGAHEAEVEQLKAEKARLRSELDQTKTLYKSVRDETVTLCAKQVQLEDDHGAAIALLWDEKEEALEALATERASQAGVAHSQEALRDRDELLAKYNELSDTASKQRSDYEQTTKEQESAIAGMVAHIDELEKDVEKKNKQLAVQKDNYEKMRAKFLAAQAEADKATANNRLKMMREDRNWQAWLANGGPSHAPSPQLDLRCPKEQKDEAKGLGAKWNGVNKTWYVPAGWPLRNFAMWLPL